MTKHSGTLPYSHPILMAGSTIFCQGPWNKSSIIFVFHHHQSYSVPLI